MKFFLTKQFEKVEKTKIVSKHHIEGKKCNVQKFTNSPFSKSRQKSAKKNMYGAEV